MPLAPPCWVSTLPNLSGANEAPVCGHSPIPTAASQCGREILFASKKAAGAPKRKGNSQKMAKTKKKEVQNLKLN